MYPMPALWLEYPLKSLEIALYPTVQVTVVRNSNVPYACFVARVPVKVVRNSHVSYSTSYSC